MNGTLKLIRLETAELILDPNAASEMVEHACFRGKKMLRVTGICACGDETILLALEPVPEGGNAPCCYRFAPMPDSSVDGVAAELKVRFRAGMSLIGGFSVNSESAPLWGLYVRN